MQFSDVANKQGIIQDITFLTGVDINAYPLVDRTRNINERYRQVLHTIFESYGGWKFMDDNVSDATTGVPYADTNIVSGTGLYTLPTGALTVEGVEIKLTSGSTFTKLYPLTHEMFMSMGGDGSFSSNGTPVYYMLQGDVIRLVPTPNFSLSSALRVYFSQDVSTFSITDTTKTPGFATPFHRALSVGASLDYALAKGLAKKNDLENLWNDYLGRIASFYAKRWKDRQPNNLTGGYRVDPMSTLT